MPPPFLVPRKAVSDDDALRLLSGGGSGEKRTGGKRPLADAGSRSHDRAMTSVWIGIIVSATVVGFLIGHLRNDRMRWAGYVALLLAPTLAMTVALALTPPAPPSFVAWWGAGMVMISPAIVVWAILATAGFAAARWSVH